MARDPTDARRAYGDHLLQRLTLVVRSEVRALAGSEGLKLVQLEALSYLGQANRYSDTPQALTEFLGLTKGTVSQTLSTLQRKGLLEKTADPKDRRVTHCRLTAKGRAVIRRASPAGLLTHASGNLLHDQVGVLESVLRALQEANGYRTFGICKSCRFFEPSTKGGQCGLTKERLSDADTQLICREHEDAA